MEEPLVQSINEGNNYSKSLEFNKTADLLINQVNSPHKHQAEKTQNKFILKEMLINGKKATGNVDKDDILIVEQMIN